MNKMNVTLKPFVQGGYLTDIRYLVRAMHLILEAGVFPKNLCSQVAAQENATSCAVQKGFSRIAKTVWDNSVGALHKEEDGYPGSLNVLHELAFLLSDGDIL